MLTPGARVALTACGLVAASVALAYGYAHAVKGSAAAHPSVSPAPSFSYSMTTEDIRSSKDCRYSVTGHSGAWLVAVRVGRAASSGQVIAEGLGSETDLPTANGGHVSPGHSVRFPANWRYPKHTIDVDVELDSASQGVETAGPDAIACTPDWK